MVTDTISIIELVWTSLCLLSFYYGARLTIRALSDYFYIKREGINSTTEYAATTTLILYGVLTINSLLFVCAGITLMTLPSPNNSVATASYVIGGIVIAKSLLKTSALFIVEKRRLILIARLEREETKYHDRREARS